MTHPTPETYAEWNEYWCQRINTSLYFETPNPVISWIEHKRLSVILRELASQPQHKILDVGCGDGVIMKMIQCGERTGIDLSCTMLDRARSRVSLGADFIQMDAEHMTFSDNSFDRICCSEVLEHVLHPQQVLSEIWRVVKPDGIVVVSIPNERLIRLCKKFVHVLHLRLLLSLSDEQKIAPLYNPWHLHNMSRSLFLQWSKKLFKCEKILLIPLTILPLRYVFVLRHQKHE
ncbi:class I SAM-dependent methyltransferase [Patescibacteria group bacterium]|nr:class I SAM-dependent methyltransferase [Patescibacteria group bacterium]MBU2259151.1 class I SAM-dependent methyltransferase [Patescibacteria group bacterium]